MPISRLVLSRALRRGTRVLPVAALTVSLVTSAAALAPSSASAATSTSGTTKSTTRQTGIDVSKWQSYAGNGVCATKGVDWRGVARTDRSFAFIKATGSSGGKLAQDPCFDRNWAGATGASIFRGAYHYAVPSAAKGSAARDARFFVAATGSLQAPGDLPPVLDLEDSGGLKPAELAAWARTWLTTVRALTGRQPVIYTGPSFWESKMANSTAFHAYPLWIAHYTSGSPRVPGGWPTWSVWQHSSSGRVAGISGAVDLNVFNGTAAQLRAFAHPGTYLTSGTSSSVAYRGQAWQLSGHLRNISGSGVSGATMLLYRQKQGQTTWEVVRTARTSSTGRYVFDLHPGKAASYRVRYSGGVSYAASWSAVRKHSFRNRYTTTVSTSVSHPTVKKHAKVKVAGHLVRNAPTRVVSGQTVVVYRKYSSGGWKQITTLRTSSTGRYAVNLHPGHTARYKVVYRGSTSKAPDTGPTRTVRVR